MEEQVDIWRGDEFTLYVRYQRPGFSSLNTLGWNPQKHWHTCTSYEDALSKVEGIVSRCRNSPCKQD